jgi:hypothetical protein
MNEQLRNEKNKPDFVINEKPFITEKEKNSDFIEDAANVDNYEIPPESANARPDYFNAL